MEHSIVLASLFLDLEPYFCCINWYGYDLYYMYFTYAIDPAIPPESIMTGRGRLLAEYFPLLYDFCDVIFIFKINLFLETKLA